MSSPTPIEKNVHLIAACGLYCGACRSYLKGRCKGCAKNEKASWCKIRSCNRERAQASCAECQDHSDPMSCKRYDTLISRLIGFVLNSDRAACIAAIRARGREAFADEMARTRRQTLPKRKR